MSKKARLTRRKKSAALKPTGVPLSEFLRMRVTTPDLRSHSRFLADMREKQAEGRLAHPATASLIDRLERAI